MSLRSKLDLRSDYPYSEYILRDLSKLFGAAYHIVIEGKRVLFYYNSSIPYAPSVNLAAGRCFDPLSDEFIEVDYCIVQKSELLRLLIDGLVDCNPYLRLIISGYGKKKK